MVFNSKVKVAIIMRLYSPQLKDAADFKMWNTKN